jgi:transposase IS4-like protein/DDE family transposase
MQHGCCVLPADEAGRILDRLAGLEKIIQPEAVRQALNETGRQNRYDCVLTHEVTCWVVLAMGVLTNMPIRQVFKHARRLRPDEATPGRSALCQARQRLGVEPLRQLFSQVVRPLATPEQTPEAFYHGLRLMGIDGTVLDVPDTPANAEAFGRPTAGSARGDGAFPQIRKVSLVELGTHVEVAFACQGVRSGGEQDAVPTLLDHLPSDSLLLEDRGFFSYPSWKRADGRGFRLLMRVRTALILEPIQQLGDDSFLAKIYPSPSCRDKDCDGIVVRVIRYTLDDGQRVGHQQEHRLLTNLLDAKSYPARELIALYHERWEEELVFDEQKTHQDPRRATKPAQLRSQTPAGVEQELYALSLAHFVLRALMTEAAARVQVDPDRLSFTGCLHILRCRLPECDSRTTVTLHRWYDALLAEIARERTDPRRNRINPRVIKRKMSNWPKKRPQHRGPPPLLKTFAQSVVMLR